MILLTGAAGKTGMAILRVLGKRGVGVRVLVRSSEQGESLEKLGASEIVIGDLREPAALEKATKGIKRVYFICPNVAPDEVQIGENLLDLSRQAGVERFVYHSVLHPQVEAMPHHWQKMRMEERIFRSGMDFTVLQPCAYMQNILAGWKEILNGVYSVPYSTSARISIVDLEDVAEAAATMLTQLNHKNAVYELAGPQALSQVEVAETIAGVLERPVLALVTDRTLWAKKAKISGMGEYQVSTLVKMFEYYEKHGLVGNPGILAWILNRQPVTFEDFITREFKRLTKSNGENQ